MESDLYQLYFKEPISYRYTQRCSGRVYASMAIYLEKTHLEYDYYKELDTNRALPWESRGLTTPSLGQAFLWPWRLFVKPQKEVFIVPNTGGQP